MTPLLFLLRSDSGSYTRHFCDPDSARNVARAEKTVVVGIEWQEPEPETQPTPESKPE